MSHGIQNIHMMFKSILAIMEFYNGHGVNPSSECEY